MKELQIRAYGEIKEVLTRYAAMRQPKNEKELINVNKRILEEIKYVVGKADTQIKNLQR